MMNAFLFGTAGWVLPVTMVVVLALMLELPYRLAKPRQPVAGEKKTVAWDIVQAGLFTLAAFVLGLSFAQSTGRFDARRELVVKEANSIGTTWLRAEQLPPALEKRFRADLTAYLSVRLTAYKTPRIGQAALDRAVARSDAYQAQLWSIASSQLKAHPTNLGLSLLMETLNDTIDVSGEQFQALTTHTPTAIISLMLLLVALATLSAGFRFARDGARPLALSALFIFANVAVVTMVVDYDRPQVGSIRVNLGPLERQLASMQQTAP